MAAIKPQLVMEKLERAEDEVLVSDVDALEARFRKVVARVRNDRNKTIAHTYEHKAQLARRLLTPRGYATVFKRVESLLNDIRVVIDNSSRSYNNLSWANSKAVAEDLVDMILSGRDCLRSHRAHGDHRAVGHACARDVQGADRC